MSSIILTLHPCTGKLWNSLDAFLFTTEWPILPVFKNYTPGEPTAKLYVKNLAKATTERDLKYIFGRYIFWQNDEEANL